MYKDENLSNTNIDLDEEIPKYKKKTGLSTSKSINKAKHKHKYIECLFIAKDIRHPRRGTYCKVCGKIGDVIFFEVEKTEQGTYLQLDDLAVIEKYSHLKYISINSIFQKYVPIIKGNDKDE